MTAVTYGFGPSARGLNCPRDVPVIVNRGDAAVACVISVTRSSTEIKTNAKISKKREAEEF